MATIDKQYEMNWWLTETRQFIVIFRVTYFIDGRMTMLSMCYHFLKARQYIYLANWGINPRTGNCAGSDQ